VQVRGSAPSVPAYRFGCGCGGFPPEAPWALGLLALALRRRRRWPLR